MKQASPQLLKEWNTRLRDSGFRDLVVGTDDGFLSSRGSGRIDSRHPSHYAANRALRAAYAHFADAVAQHGHFEDTRERRIWALHVSGLGYRAIARELGKPETRHRIETTIKRITARATYVPPTSEKAFRRAIRNLVRKTDPRTLVALVALFNTARNTGGLTVDSLSEAEETTTILKDPTPSLTSNWGVWESDTPDPIWFVSDGKWPAPGPVRHLVKNGKPVK